MKILVIILTYLVPFDCGQPFCLVDHYPRLPDTVQTTILLIEGESIPKNFKHIKADTIGFAEVYKYETQ